MRLQDMVALRHSENSMFELHKGIIGEATVEIVKSNPSSTGRGRCLIVRR